MNIWEIDKLQIFIMFVIPGFITLKTYELLYPSQIKDSSKQIIDAVTYSCINYALLYWLIVQVETSELKTVHSGLYTAFYMFVLLIFPIIIAFLWKMLRESEYFQKRIHHPTQMPWDYFFAKKECCWVKITLKNGDVIGGYYGTKSFASNAPATEQVYLEQKWVLSDKGAFEREVKNTFGVIILTSEISHIEFRK